jgi:hypothetical protein
MPDWRGGRGQGFGDGREVGLIEGGIPKCNFGTGGIRLPGARDVDRLFSVVFFA